MPEENGFQRKEEEEKKQWYTKCDMYVKKKKSIGVIYGVHNVELQPVNQQK